jgi:signal transduction histidine kinase
MRREVDGTAVRVAYGGVMPSSVGPRRQPRWLLAPIVLAVIQVGGTFGAAQGQPTARQPDAYAVALALVGPIALLLIPGRTRLLLVAISAATFVYVALGYPYGPVFASFAAAVAITVTRGLRLAAWSAVAGALALAVIARLAIRGEPWSWSWLIGVLAWGLIVVGIGELVRANRARLAEAGRARSESRRREAGEERLRIARELHDVVAHHMSLIHVQAGVALHMIDRKPEQVESALQTIKDASKEALTELRALIGVLRSEGEAAPTAPVASLSALDELAARTSQAGTTTTVEVHGRLESVPQPIGAAVFRIAQEAMTNVVRHSGATTARIRVEIDERVVALTVTDNGRGISQSVEGTGLRGMRERAAAFHGTISLVPAPDGGAVLRAALPREGVR